MPLSEERIAFTLSLLRDQTITKGDLKRALRARFGPMTAWQIEPLLAAARSRLIHELTGLDWPEYLRWTTAYYGRLAAGEDPGPRPPFTGKQLAALLALNGARPRAPARARET